MLIMCNFVLSVKKYLVKQFFIDKMTRNVSVTIDLLVFH